MQSLLPDMPELTEKMQARLEKQPPLQMPGLPPDPTVIPYFKAWPGGRKKDHRPPDGLRTKQDAIDIHKAFLEAIGADAGQKINAIQEIREMEEKLRVYQAKAKSQKAEINKRVDAVLAEYNAATEDDEDSYAQNMRDADQLIRQLKESGAARNQIEVEVEHWHKDNMGLGEEAGQEEHIPDVIRFLKLEPENQDGDGGGDVLLEVEAIEQHAKQLESIVVRRRLADGRCWLLGAAVCYPVAAGCYQVPLLGAAAGCCC